MTEVCAWRPEHPHKSVVSRGAASGQVRARECTRVRETARCRCVVEQAAEPVDNPWPVTAAAGVSVLRPHELRHFYASGLIASGCDVVTIQRALGHASAAETLDTYSHLWARLRRPHEGRSRLRAEDCRGLIEDSRAPACAKAQVRGGRRTSRPVRRVLSSGASRPPDRRSSI